MEAVILVGLPGAGKSTFYRERFLDTHTRINLDTLKTRRREERLLQACVETQRPFVIDNTNPSRWNRQVYIQAAKEAGFRVIGYVFQSRFDDCMRRNEQRPDDQQVPLSGFAAIAGRMERPSLAEGFDELHYVKIDDACGFAVEEWRDEV